MKNLTLILFLLSSFSFAQKTHLYLGIKTLHGTHIAYEINIKDHIRIGTQITYYQNLVNSIYYNTGSILPVFPLIQGINQQGFGFAFLYGFPSERKENKWQYLMFEFQKLKSGNYIQDPGYFGGTTQGDYAEFHENYDNLLISYCSRKLIDKNRRFEFFYEFGLNFCGYTRFYTIDGTYSNQKPSNKTNMGMRVLPVARAGFNFRVF